MHLSAPLRGRARLATAIATAIVVGAMIASGCGGNSGTASSGGDGAAARRLHAVARAMTNVTGYDFDASIALGATAVALTGEFQAPDRVHQTVTVGGVSAETIFIGSNAYVKDSATSAWHDRVQAGAPASTDLRGAFDALGQTSAVTRRDDVYRFRLDPGVAARLINATPDGPVTGSARLTDGNVTELTYRATVQGQQVDVTVQYSAFGSAPPVEAPPTV